ncbi:tryptophan--tRNA ligase [Eubacteriales bacterium OttesenSCG-928-G02]|nr:tryptophan--tRNA ligase [Eubacteriales bacterium OttesenSCG-928-G02]
MNDVKKTIFSGVQPSGELTIGNYIGALKNWKALQDDYNCIYCIVDMHAITVRQTPSELRKKSLELFALYLACGIDSPNNIFFIQSHVPAHAELMWVLNCNTMFGELSRMTQFKDKSKKHSDNINAGLFTYPVLMASDILLYQTDLVPVGADQMQHIEITRDIAIRFNNAYGETFKVPEPLIQKVGKKIASLTDPTKKMSKSDVSGGSISLYDNYDIIIKKIKRAVTDSGSEVRYDESKPGINNLMSIYSAFTDKEFDEIEKEFDGKGYGFFKEAVGITVADEVKKIQDKFYDLMNNKDYLEGILSEGAPKAAHLARKTLSKVYRKVGFYKI